MSAETPTSPALPARELVGRAALLAEVQRLLHATSRVALTPPAGSEAFGWGASRVAEATVAQLGTGIQAIHLRGRSEVAFHVDVLRALGTLQLPEATTRRGADPVLSLRRWLRTHSDWALTVSDLDDPDLLGELLEDVTGGRVLVMSPNPPSRFERVEVGPLGTAEAAEWLVKLCSTVSTGWDAGDAEAIVDALDAHALSLELAAGWLTTTQQLPDALLTAVSNSDNTGSPLTRVIRAALTTLAATATAAPSGSPVRQALAAFCTLLHGDPDDVLDQGLAVPPLVSLKLLRRNESSRYSLPWGVWVSGYKLLSKLQRQQGAESAIMLSGKPTTPDLLQELLQGGHVARVDRQLLQRDALATRLLERPELNLAEISAIESAGIVALEALACPRAVKLLRKVSAQRLREDPSNTATAATLEYVAVGLLQMQSYQMARKHLRQALELHKSNLQRSLLASLAVGEIDVNENRLDRAESRLKRAATVLTRFPESDFRRLRCRFLLAACRLGRGDFAAARNEFAAVLDIRRRTLPADHPELLKTRLMCARTMFLVRDYDAAEAILREDLQIRTESPHVSDSDRITTVNFLGELLFTQGRYAEAEPFYQQVHDLRSEWLNPRHRLLGEATNRLAVLRAARGAHRDAEPLFRKALVIHEEVFGAEHPEVARLLNDLAESLFTQSKFDQARRLLERALRIQEKSLRRNAAGTARTRCNLAAIYGAWGRFTQAEQLYRQDLASKRESFAPEHPAVATAINNLAETLRSQGKCDEAETLFREAFELRRQALGEQHPLVAQSYSNLGYLYLQLHRYDEARPAFEKALAIRAAMLSATHPHLAITSQSLGECLFAEGEYAAAREHLHRALDVFRTVHGDKHPQTCLAAVAAGRNDLRLGKRARAELNILRFQAILQEVLGADHRFNSRALLGQAELLTLDGKYDAAFPLLERCLAIQRQTMAHSRLEIAETLQAIAENLQHRGLLVEAVPRLVDSLAIQESVLDPGHPGLAPTLLLLGRAFVEKKDFAAAEPLLRRSLRLVALHPLLGPAAREENLDQLAQCCIKAKKPDEARKFVDELVRLREKRLGPNSVELLPALSALAGVCYLQQRPAEAEPAVQRCVSICEAAYGPEHPETAKHLDNLAGVYFMQDRYQDAEPFIERSIAILELHPNTLDRLTTALENYATLLRRTSRTSDAAAVELRLAQLQAPPPPPEPPPVSLKDSGNHVLDELF